MMQFSPQYHSIHKVYTKPQTRQHNQASDDDGKVKPNRGTTPRMIIRQAVVMAHLDLARATTSARSVVVAATHTMVGGTRHNTREKQCPAWGRKCYTRGLENHFANVCHVANKMHFVKHESSNAYVNEPMMQHESNVEYNRGLYHTTSNITRSC